jgi:hypothetical protein
MVAKKAKIFTVTVGQGIRDYVRSHLREEGMTILEGRYVDGSTQWEFVVETQKLKMPIDIARLVWKKFPNISCAVENVPQSVIEQMWW